MSTVKVQHKVTKEIKTATYAMNTGGNMRYHLPDENDNYKSISDKQFTKNWTIISDNDLRENN